MVLNVARMVVHSFGMEIFEEVENLGRFVLGLVENMMGAEVVMQVVLDLVVRVAIKVVSAEVKVVLGEVMLLALG